MTDTQCCCHTADGGMIQKLPLEVNAMQRRHSWADTAVTALMGSHSFRGGGLGLACATP